MDEVLVRPDGYYYSEDTANNREVYKKSYRIVNGKTTKLKDKHRQQGQHGLVIDGGITQFANNISGRRKRAQRSIDELESDQKKRFVETRYTPQLVNLVTNLTGDSLAHFMNAYPMTYYFATNAKELEFKMWIRDNYKHWLSNGRPIPRISDKKEGVSVE